MVAYGQGDTFSSNGLAHIAPDMCEYTAYFHAAEDNTPVHLRAVDINAATMWLRAHFIGPFHLAIRPRTVLLGHFEDEALTQDDLAKGLSSTLDDGGPQALARLFITAFDGPRMAGAQASTLLEALREQIAEGGQS